MLYNYISYYYLTSSGDELVKSDDQQDDVLVSNANPRDRR